MANSSLAAERCARQETAKYQRPGLLTLQLCKTKEGFRWLAPLPPPIAILFDLLWLEADERGRVRISLRDLAEIFRCSRETIRRRLRRLQAAGLIARYRRSRGPAVIYIRWRPLGRDVFQGSFPQEFSTSEPQSADDNGNLRCHTGVSHSSHCVEMPKATQPTGVFHKIASQEERYKRLNNGEAFKAEDTPSVSSRHREFRRLMAYLRENFVDAFHELLPDFDFFEDSLLIPEELSLREFIDTLINAIGRALYYHPALWEADPEDFLDFVVGNLIEKEGFNDTREIYAWAGWLMDELEARQP